MQVFTFQNSHLFYPSRPFSCDCFLRFFCDFVGFSRDFVPIDLYVAFISCDLQQDDGSPHDDCDGLADFHSKKTGGPEIIR